MGFVSSNKSIPVQEELHEGHQEKIQQIPLLQGPTQWNEFCILDL